MRTEMTGHIRHAALAAMLVFLPLLVSADDDHGRSPTLVIFGDSLSDSGNFFASSGVFSVRPFELVPSAPYAVGGLHFSNGSTWAEQLAWLLEDRRSGKPSLRQPGRFTNYAFGTARSRTVGSGFDLGDQVGMFLGDFRARLPRESTYVLWTGANDVRDALVALQTDPSGAISYGILQAAITAMADNIYALYGGGAQHFLVANSPNIGLTPAVRELGEQAEAAALQLTLGYNQGLSQALDGLSALPGVSITRFDVFAVLTELVADPDSAGFVNVTDACITPDVLAGAICRHPGGYLFWDGIHPTRAGHRYLAEAALAELADE